MELLKICDWSEIFVPSFDNMVNAINPLLLISTDTEKPVIQSKAIPFKNKSAGFGRGLRKDIKINKPGEINESNSKEVGN